MIETEQLGFQVDDENGLVRAAVEGDRSAFDQLVRRHSSRVYRVALVMLGNREDAEDVQQEVFVRAYRKLGTFRGRSSFATWLHSITARLCLERRRRRSHRYEELSEDALLYADKTGKSPESIVISMESAGKIQHILSMMAPNDRLLIILKCIEQYDHQEIAQVLDCSLESSRARLSRAKKIFREMYSKME